MAKAEKAQPEAEGEGAAGGGKKKRGKRLIIIIVVALLLLGVGGAVALHFLGFITLPFLGGGGDQPAVTETMPGEGGAPVEEMAGDPGTGPGGISNGARIERQSPLPRNSGIVVPLPSVKVNLADPAGRRYLTVGLEVELNEDLTAQIQQQAPRVRDAVILLLAAKTYGDVATPEGKVILKGEIAARLNQILGGQRVIRVYFTDFVVE